MAIPIKAVLSVSTKAFTKGFGLATKALGGFVALAKTAALAIAGITAATVALTLRQAALIDRLGKVSAVTGVSTDLLQKFGFAAEQAGVSTDQAQVALRRFSRRLGEAQKGTGELLPALRRLNIETKNSDGSFKSAEEVLLEFADAISKTEDPSQRLALAFKAFDSEGAELVKTLEDGSAGLQEFFNQAQAFGLVLERSAIQGVEDFNDSLNLLIRTLDGQVKRVVAAFAPDLEKLTDFLATSIKDAAEAAGGYDNLARILRNKVLDILIAVVSAFERLAQVFLIVGRGILTLARQFSGDPFLGMGKSAIEAQQKIKDLNAEINELQTPQFSKTGKLTFFPNSAEDAKRIKEIRQEIIELEKVIEFDTLFGDDASFSNIIEVLEKLKDSALTTTEYVKDFKVATTETNRELDLTLGYWERIILQIGDFFTRDLPAKIKESIESVRAIFKSVQERLLEMTDPVKTLEDGLVKAGKAFEDALVDAIMTGKANFEDFRNLLRETLARAIVQRFITEPIFGLFKAKGGPVKQGNPYIVGEEGPELFVPGASGTIIPNKQTMSMGAGGGAGPTVINISAVDTQSFQQALARDPEFIYNVTRAGARRTPGG